MSKKCFLMKTCNVIARKKCNFIGFARRQLKTFVAIADHQSYLLSFLLILHKLVQAELHEMWNATKTFASSSKPCRLLTLSRTWKGTNYGIYMLWMGTSQAPFIDMKLFMSFHNYNKNCHSSRSLPFPRKNALASPPSDTWIRTLVKRTINARPSTGCDLDAV